MNTTKLFEVTAPRLSDRCAHKRTEVLAKTATKAIKLAENHLWEVHGEDTYDTGLLEAKCVVFCADGTEPGFRVLWEGEEFHPGDLDGVVLVEPYSKVPVAN